MKALSISGLTLSILNFLAAIYLQFNLVPAHAALEASIDTGFAEELTALMLMAAHEAMVNVGMILIFSSALSLLLCIFSVAKKINSKAGLTGIVLSMITLVIGLIYGTHMFT